MRLFVAIEVPESWREAAAAVQRELIERVPPGTLRPVDPALLHLTLRFLSEVEDEALRALERELAAVAPVDVELALGAAGSFGAARATRVAWLAVNGDAAGLAALATRVERAAAAAPPEPRPLSPHLTLARVTRGADPAARRVTRGPSPSCPRPRRQRSARAGSPSCAHTSVGWRTAPAARATSCSRTTREGRPRGRTPGTRRQAQRPAAVTGGASLVTPRTILTAARRRPYRRWWRRDA